jgi:tetratricopeptide (TPR) repeat protein
MNYSYLAKEKFLELNDKKKYGKTLILISEEYLKKEDIASAIKYSKMALEVFKNDEDRNYESKIENDLGKLFYEFDNIEESFVHLNIAKEMRKKSSGPEIIETLTSICENYIKLKDVENSKKTLEEILDNISQGDKNSLLKYYMLKYRVDMLSNSIVEAENTLFLALDYAENCTLIKEVAEISILIGKFYIDVGNDKKATLYLDKGVDLFKKLGILNDL